MHPWAAEGVHARRVPDGKCHRPPALPEFHSFSGNPPLCSLPRISIIPKRWNFTVCKISCCFWTWIHWVSCSASLCTGLSFFFIKMLYWSIFDFKCYADFFHTAKWFSYTYVCRLLMFVTKPYSTLPNPTTCNLPGSSVCGILWVRLLEWVAIPFSRESSQPGSLMSPTLAGGFFTISAIWEAPYISVCVCLYSFSFSFLLFHFLSSGCWV